MTSSRVNTWSIYNHPPFGKVTSEQSKTIPGKPRRSPTSTVFPISRNSPSSSAWSDASTPQVSSSRKKLDAKSGNVYLRYYLIEGANLMRQHHLEYQAYSRKYDEVPKHKCALVLTARKLVRLAFALLTKNQP